MSSEYREHDYEWIRELRHYPEQLAAQLDDFEHTGQITIPEDPIERVVFQNRAKSAIRKVAQNKGHILMVGRPGTGKSLLADMFKEVLDKSIGDFIRPKESIVAYPGKDRHHIRVAYEQPDVFDRRIEKLSGDIETASNNVAEFSLEEQVRAVVRVKHWLVAAAIASGIAGFWFPQAFIVTGLTGIGAIFMFIQQNNHRAQESIQRENQGGRQNAVKHLQDMAPEVLYDPRKDRELMVRIAEPDARNMKGGFRHDPYQSGALHTPSHKRAFLGAHATAPIIYIDELKTLIKAGYMPDLLEIMQNKHYTLEGGKNAGSGAADRAETPLRADNILIACCNHDTLQYLQEEGDGAFLSRVEDQGEVILMDSTVAETSETLRQAAQYVKQEIDRLGAEFERVWGTVIALEGHDGVRKRSEHIFGRPLPEDYTLAQREFSRAAVMEIIKELRCRAADGKLSCLLRPVNGIIRSAEYEAILENAPQVSADHVRRALVDHLSIEGEMSRELLTHKKDLKKYISTMSDSIGYVVGAGGHHQPLQRPDVRSTAADSLPDQCRRHRRGHRPGQTGRHRQGRSPKRPGLHQKGLQENRLPLCGIRNARGIYPGPRRRGGGQRIGGHGHRAHLRLHQAAGQPKIRCHRIAHRRHHPGGRRSDGKSPLHHGYRPRHGRGLHPVAEQARRRAPADQHRVGIHLIRSYPRHPHIPGAGAKRSFQHLLL